MLYGFYFGRLAIRVQGISAVQFHEFTIELNVEDVFASTALTGISLGLLDGVPGMANSYVKKYGRYLPGWSGIDEVTTSDPYHNSVYIAMCTYVNFRLAAVQADAGMQGTVLVLSPPHTNSAGKGRKTMAYDFMDNAGKKIGSHAFSLLESNSRVAVDEQLEALREELARSRETSSPSIGIRERKGHVDVFALPVQA
jgi:hypothetical protein